MLGFEQCQEANTPPGVEARTSFSSVAGNQDLGRGSNHLADPERGWRCQASFSRAARRCYYHLPLAIAIIGCIRFERLGLRGSTGPFEPLNLLFLTSHSPFEELTGALAAGAEYAMRRIAEQLAARGHRVVYVTLHDGEERREQVGDIDVRVLTRRAMRGDESRPEPEPSLLRRLGLAICVAPAVWRRLLRAAALLRRGPVPAMGAESTAAGHRERASRRPRPLQLVAPGSTRQRLDRE